MQLSYLGLLGDSFSPGITYIVEFPNAIPIAAQHNVLRNVTDFRVIVNQGTPKREVKYISVSPDVRRFAVRKSRYSDVSAIKMPVLPAGDWKTADIALRPDGKKIIVAATNCESHPSVSETWHPSSFDFLDLEILDMPHSTDRVKLVSHPRLDTPGHLAVMKYSPFPDGIIKIDVETEMYRSLDKDSIAPKFLGHVKEENRVIGFLVEYIDGARFVDSDGDFSDLALNECRKALKNLHELGISHRDSHPGNCLLREDGTAVLVDFELATQSSNTRDFERDFELLDPDRLKISI
ncbi:hypothetical protein GGR51DRAFT_572639 [Nemania sp. FL0031]|nr:hypothetical protein GGR51DRAFT_572639 [Nemania sp. FL0031]